MCGKELMVMMQRHCISEERTVSRTCAPSFVWDAKHTFVNSLYVRLQPGTSAELCESLAYITLTEHTDKLQWAGRDYLIRHDCFIILNCLSCSVYIRLLTVFTAVLKTAIKVSYCSGIQNTVNWMTPSSFAVPVFQHVLEQFWLFIWMIILNISLKSGWPLNHRFTQCSV